MKSLLSENMLRFGTKNLTATSKQELIVKSIMETIDQHGLRNVIKKQLNEQKAGDFVQFEADNSGLFPKQEVEGKGWPIDQTPTSIGEAKQILGMMMKSIGSGDPEGQMMKSAIAKIKSTNYPAILYIVKYVGMNGKRFNKLCDWLSLYMDKPHGNSGFKPGTKIVDFVLGTDTAKLFNTKFQQELQIVGEQLYASAPSGESNTQGAQGF